MPKNILFIVLALAVGMLVGAFALRQNAAIPGSTWSESADFGTANSVAPAATADDSAAPLDEVTALSASDARQAEPSLATEEAPGDASTDALPSELQSITAGWLQLRTDFERLRERVVSLEQRLAEAATREANAEVESELPERPGTPDARRAALVSAGVAEEEASDLVWRQGQIEMSRLDLRDVALREGWFDTDRYRDELRRLNENTPDVRQEVGDEAYDRFLFATGEYNRVQIDSVIAGSPAEDVGLQPGDVVTSYNGERIFDYRALRRATGDGERGEQIPIEIRRRDNVIQAWLPRGPLGVRLDLTRADPDA